MTSDSFDNIPDVRDGLTRKDRIILYCLEQLQKECKGRNVLSAMLYGRVSEYLDISMDEYQTAIAKLADRGNPL